MGGRITPKSIRVILSEGHGAAAPNPISVSKVLPHRSRIPPQIRLSPSPSNPETLLDRMSRSNTYRESCRWAVSQPRSRYWATFDRSGAHAADADCALLLRHPL